MYNLTRDKKEQLYFAATPSSTCFVLLKVCSQYNYYHNNTFFPLTTSSSPYLVKLLHLVLIS